MMKASSYLLLGLHQFPGCPTFGKYDKQDWQSGIRNTQVLWRREVVMGGVDPGSNGFEELTISGGAGSDGSQGIRYGRSQGSGKRF